MNPPAQTAKPGEPGCDRGATWRTGGCTTTVVWATHERLQLIDEAAEHIIRGTLHSKAKDLQAFIHSAGMVADHIHLVASIPPTVAIADVISQLKGSSSHAVNHLSNRSVGEDSDGRMATPC